MEAIDVFHQQNPTVALRVDVTRHPFSFRGSQHPSSKEEQDITWKWKDDLNIYAGDEIEQYLHAMGLPYRTIEILRTPGGVREALDEPTEHRDELKVLEIISRKRRADEPWTVENLQKRIKTITDDDLRKPRGKQISELDIIAGDNYKAGLQALGDSVDIAFNFDVNFRWYPVESQRVLLYAIQFGASESFADALARRHFTMGQASGDRSTVLDAAEEVGLDRDAVEKMLTETKDYEDEVWKSYQDTTGKHRISSIPFFTFNGPDTNGGKFRSGGPFSGELTVNGSGNVDQFLRVFKAIHNRQPVVAPDAPVTAEK